MPVTRFAVCSDLHIRGEGDERLSRLKKLMRLSYAGLGTVDAFLFVGDLTDHGTREELSAFWSAVTGEKRPGTRVFSVLSRHHDNWEFGRDGEKTGLGYYEEITGLPTSFSDFLGPYPLIGVSTCEAPGVYYTEAQVEWLEQRLSEAEKASPGLPIFVLQHEHVNGTVFGSFPEDGWGGDWFTETLSRHPRAVHFSGHSHYPLNDPRSFWRGAFTAVGTGAVSYAELTVDGVRKIHPAGFEEMAQGWLVEAEGDRLRLVGFDFLSGQKLCEYVLDGAPPERPAPPRFAPGAKPEVVRTEEGAFARIKRALEAPNAPVVLYRVCPDNGAPFVVVPPYWRAHPDESYLVPLPEETAAVRVKACDAYGEGEIV